MKLADVCATLSELRFPHIGDHADPDRGAVLELRSRITAALADGEFLVDCIAHELQFLARCWDRRGLARFFVAPEFGVGFSFYLMKQTFDVTEIGKWWFETTYLCIAFVHFYLDGLIWSFRRPHVRQTILPFLLGRRGPASATWRSPARRR